MCKWYSSVIALILIFSFYTANLIIGAEKTDNIKASNNNKIIISDDDKLEANNLINFLYNSPSQHHAVKTVADKLLSNGFTQINYAERWKLKKGEKCFVIKNKSTLIAFIINSEKIKSGFNIIAAHTDSPGIHIKPNPEIVEEDYLKLNTEIYGEPILTSWFDRPLCLSGQVFVKSKNVFQPEIKLININKPIAMIVNLAVHLTEKNDKSAEESKQEVMLPILQTVSAKFEKGNFLRKYIASALAIKECEILDFGLMFYPYAKGTIWGTEDEFIASARIDDLEAVYAGLNALLNSKNNLKINVLACIDNEEVGSLTKQGAYSPFLSNVLEKITYSLSGNREDFFTAIENSFIISADVGHASHPNYISKTDPTNHPLINKGILVSVSEAMYYLSDPESIGIIKSIAEKAEVPLQMSPAHSDFDIDAPDTFGPIINTHLDIKGVDLGLPILGMHSTAETCGVLDHIYMIKLLKEFYSSK